MLRAAFYRLLLRVYPAQFRRELGRDMELAFHSLCDETRSGPRRIGVYAREALDAVRSGWRERRRRTATTSRHAASDNTRRGVAPAGKLGAPGEHPSPRGFHGGFFADVRQAARLFRHQPGFVLVVGVTLGLGVGSAGVVFSMANELLLRPPPGVADHRDAAVLTFRTNERDYVGISGPDMEALREAATLLDGFASTDTLPSSAYVSAGGSRPVALNAYSVYGDYFELLGVRPAVGRLLSAGETGPGDEPLVAVISERLWETLFGRSPGVVGRQIQMAGQRLTVIGVAGGGFRGTFPGGWGVDVWTPRSAQVPLEGDRREHLWSRDRRLDQDFVVRLRPGVTLAAAEEQLNGIIGRLTDADPEHREFLSELRAYLTPGLHMPRTRERILSTLRAFAGAAALVVLIACANVANLLLVRALQNRGDVAVRRALGASTGQIARQCLVESALLAAAGTAVGLLVAWAIGFAFRDVRALPGFGGFALDLRVAGFAVAAIAGTTLLFGVVPALLSGRFDLDTALRGAARGATRRDSLVRHAMSATQIALSLTLLTGGVLLARTVHNLYAMETGIAVEDVSVVPVDLGVNRLDDAGRAVLYRRLAEAVDALCPGSSGPRWTAGWGPFGVAPGYGSPRSAHRMTPSNRRTCAGWGRAGSRSSASSRCLAGSSAIRTRGRRRRRSSC